MLTTARPADGSASASVESTAITVQSDSPRRLGISWLTMFPLLDEFVTGRRDHNASPVREAPFLDARDLPQRRVGTAWPPGPWPDQPARRAANAAIPAEPQCHDGSAPSSGLPPVWFSYQSVPSRSCATPAFSAASAD